MDFVPNEVWEIIFMYVGRYVGLAIFVCRRWKEIISHAVLDTALTTVFNQSVGDNNDKLVNWLIRHRPRLTDHTFCPPAKHGNMEMLTLLMSKRRKDLPYSHQLVDGIILAATDRDPESVIKWIVEMFGIRPDKTGDYSALLNIGIRRLAMRGCLSVIQYLYEKEPKLKESYQLTYGCLIQAVIGHQQHVVEWIHKNAQDTCFAHIHMFHMLEVCEEAFINKNYRYIRYYHQIFPCDMNIIWAAMRQADASALEWLETALPQLVSKVLDPFNWATSYIPYTYGDQPPEWIRPFTEAVRGLNLDALNWLVKIGISLEDCDAIKMVIQNKAKKTNAENMESIWVWYTKCVI